jgi:predicted permease
MGIPILRGRGFTSADGDEAARVVVINETMARQFFPGEDPVGRQMIYNSRRQGDSRTIVGVVGDVHHFGLDSDPAPEFYTPQHQPPSYHGMTIVMQVEGDPSSLVAAASAEVRALEPNAPIHDVRTTEQLLTESVAEARFRTMLLGAFAALALLLAIVGTYGVISMVVNQRAREMGIRLALGASASDIRRLVVVQGVRPVLLGLAIGLAGGLLASRAARSLLFHVAPGDPVTLSSAALIILAAAAIAAWLPARRASRVDPVVVLRV